MRALLVVMFLAVASPAMAEPKIAFERIELPNGLVVYVVEDHRVPVVYEVMWVRVGSKDEAAGRTGFAHLFEHLMFKGSAHLPDGLMDRLLEEAGGYSTAFTTPDMTVYINYAASNFVEQVLWIEADRLAGLLETFDKPKLDNQRSVVLNERRQSYENRPYGNASLFLSENLWPRGHGYNWPTIGLAADLKAAAPADVSAFFRKYYAPNNLTMVIAGDVKVANVKALVEKYFAWIPRGADVVRPRYATPAPIAKQLVVDTTDDVQVPRIYLAWRGPASFGADEPALDLAAAVLGGGKTSLLYKRFVYDEKIAQDVEVEWNGAELGGTLEIVATAKPAVDPKRLAKEIAEEVAKLAAKGPDDAEVTRARSAHEAAFLRRLESVLGRSITLATYAVQAKDPGFLAKDLARYRAVTAAQIKAVTAKYLGPNAHVTLTIRPGKKVIK